MATRDDADDLDLTLAGTWRKDDEPLARWTLRAGGERYELIADRATADALLALFRALPAGVERLRRERDRLAAEVDDLTKERDALAKRSPSAAPSPAAPAPATPGPEHSAPTALADVPLAMIGTFRPDDPRIKAAAKKDPLMALAVQVAKATGPDANDLDRARLRAMATAVSRNDMTTFWSASTERSKKKLSGGREQSDRPTIRTRQRAGR